MDRSLDLYKVQDNSTIRDAILKMNEGGLGFICIVNPQDKVKGVVTDGDFRRAVLKGVSIERSILDITNTQYQFLKVGFTQAQAFDLVLNTPAQHIPVIDDGKMVGLVNVEDFLPQGQNRHYRENCQISLVVMAGGQGTRLVPFTNILPKLLMPLGEKSVIEHILGEFSSFGIQDVIISINHKNRMVKAYFEELKDLHKVRFITEDKPLGTAGSLRLMKDMLRSPFFLTNCDVLVKANYWEIYDFHQGKGFDMTMVAAQKKYVIPYGVCHVHHEGYLDKIDEKPQLDFLISTGLYVISPSVLDMIPEGEIFNMDALIAALRKKGKKIGIFPVDEKGFLDIGQLDEYKAALAKIELFSK